MFISVIWNAGYDERPFFPCCYRQFMFGWLAGNVYLYITTHLHTLIANQILSSIRFERFCCWEMTDHQPFSAFLQSLRLFDINASSDLRHLSINIVQRKRESQKFLHAHLVLSQVSEDVVLSVPYNYHSS